MILDELLAELNKLKDAGHGDLDIFVIADHGQNAESAHSVSLEDFSEDDQDFIHEDDLGEYEGFELVKAILISG
tara:strand:- start:384 stop:605 length:222 start_codon:yes stop_codon:yes gene_type:complete